VWSDSPRSGDYEHCFTLENPQGEFIQLAATIAEYVGTADRTVARRTTSAITHAALQKGSDEDQSYADWAYDLLDDAVPAFHKQPIVTAS
jgi:hypothetical protein